MEYLEPYLPAVGEWASLGACVLVMISLTALGASLTGQRRAGGLELLAGWGIVAGLLVPLQWLIAPDLRWYAAILVLAAVAALLVRRRALLHNDLWRPALLLLPALVVACGVPLDEWDSFSHWGINTAWLWRFDALPAPGLPMSPSSNPDYPYGYPLVLYLASLARGAYIENAGAIVNLLTLVGVASGLALFAAGDDRERLDARPWYWSAWGVLAVMALNPGFVRSTTLAAYADTAFAAALLFLCVAAWRLVEAAGDRRAWTAATGAAALALVSVKEGGLLLLGVVAIALLLLGLRWRASRGRLLLVMAALLPALLVALAWQAWVAGWLPSSFSVLPWTAWRFDLLPELVAAAGADVLDHLLYYLLLVAVVVLGIRGAWRRGDAADRFHALAGLVVLGHFATMLLAYLGASFTGEEVARAASFHRYATQLAPLALGSILLEIGNRLRRRDFAPRRPGLVVGACLLVMVVGAPYLHRDRSPMETFYLEQGRDMARILPEVARVGLIGWRGEPYGYFLLRYALFRPGLEGRGIHLERLFRPLAEAGEPRRRQLQRLARREDLSHLLVVDSVGLQAGRGTDMLLLARQGPGWQAIERWRQP